MSSLVSIRWDELRIGLDHARSKFPDIILCAETLSGLFVRTLALYETGVPFERAAQRAVEGWVIHGYRRQLAYRSAIKALGRERNREAPRARNSDALHHRLVPPPRRLYDTSVLRHPMVVSEIGLLRPDEIQEEIDQYSLGSEYDPL